MSEVGYGSKKVSIQVYRKMKIKMLEREFMIPLKPEEKNHINELETEAAIDRYARTILQKYWN